MVAYTDDARVTAGGTAQIKENIEKLILETNTGYQNSEVTQQVYSIHSMEVNYEETGDLKKDLDRLINPKDGYLDEINIERDVYGADAVVLIVDKVWNIWWPLGMIGGSYAMLNPSENYEDRAYTVIDLDDVSQDGFAFSHELGHIMSALHEWEVNDWGDYSPFTYNHAYIHYNGLFQWITVMGLAKALSTVYLQ